MIRGNIGEDLPERAIVVSTAARDMAAFDRLPPEVRAVLREAPVSVSAKALLPMLWQCSGPALARAVRSALMGEFSSWTPPA